jgi:hypothetical protein
LRNPTEPEQMVDHTSPASNLLQMFAMEVLEETAALPSSLAKVSFDPSIGSCGSLHR